MLDTTIYGGITSNGKVFRRFFPITFLLRFDGQTISLHGKIVFEAFFFFVDSRVTNGKEDKNIEKQVRVKLRHRKRDCSIVFKARLKLK